MKRSHCLEWTQTILSFVCKKEASTSEQWWSSTSEKKSVTIGVLGLQGDIEENVAATSHALQELHIDGSVDMVRYPEEIEKMDGLILPGGETTVHSSLVAHTTLNDCNKEAYFRRYASAWHMRWHDNAVQKGL